ncbi:iron donor protein CyaY [Nannocystis pusilla]|uniref:iron donor protein CyaY n=1 Tax=Nannocystis pusilla TaxID=889268 RepID=UPI003DA28879
MTGSARSRNPHESWSRRTSSSGRPRRSSTSTPASAGSSSRSSNVQLAGDVLTLSFKDGARFVINAHSAAGQIWMAAGTTAWHFDFVPEQGQWIARKSDEELMATVARVVGAKLGTEVSL